MAQPLSIEDRDEICFITTRTAGSRLWLINSSDLQAHILGALAKYQQVHEVVLYAFIIMGNHYHLIARFPRANRALFMRDFNSAVARLVGRFVGAHGRRSVWARRYARQALPQNEDVEHWFFYAALNPVLSGLVDNISHYNGYNSFLDAASETARTYQSVDWSALALRRRTDPKASPMDFLKTYTLTFSRLPGFKDERNYRAILFEKLAGRTKEAVAARRSGRKSFLGASGLRAQKVGQAPYRSKVSHRYSLRPLVLTLCKEAKKAFLSTYFELRAMFSEASKAFRAGNRLVAFPSGTYPPPILEAA